MKAKVIKTQLEYEATLARIERLMEAKRNTPQGDELELLTLLVQDYEERVFPIDKPDPLEAIRFRMEQQGLKPHDLVPLLGSRSRVSEVLAGRAPSQLENDSSLGRPARHSSSRSFRPTRECVSAYSSQEFRVFPAIGMRLN